jgi:16S rRNA (guanine527-N7)-methyltransferase
MDLGSGGGLPALVLAVLWPTSEWLLIDSNGRKADWLQDAILSLGISSRVDVRCERAELTGRSEYRNTAELVTARGFGPPASTAECGAPLLQQGGHLLVTDPPGGQSDRWPTDGLAELGLELDSSEEVATAVGPVSISRISSIADCGPRYPRRVGVPFKRPLF